MGEKDAKYKIPPFRWAEDKKDIFLTVELGDVKNGKVDITEEKFHFSGTKDDNYQIDFAWNHEVNPKESTYAFKHREVEIKIRKKDTKADFWLLLYKKAEKAKFKTHCKCDWNLWRDEDDDDEAKPGMGDFGMGGMPGMGGMGGMPGMGGMGGMGDSGPTYESDDESDSDDDDIPELEGADDDAKKEVKKEEPAKEEPAKEAKVEKKEVKKADDELPELEAVDIKEKTEAKKPVEVAEKPTAEPAKVAEKKS